MLCVCNHLPLFLVHDDGTDSHWELGIRLALKPRMHTFSVLCRASRGEKMVREADTRGAWKLPCGRKAQVDCVLYPKCCHLILPLNFRYFLFLIFIYSLLVVNP